MQEDQKIGRRVERVLLWFALALGALIVCYNLFYTKDFGASSIVIATEGVHVESSPEREPPEKAEGIAAVPQSSSFQGKLNLNTATASEIAAVLPGVGETLAARIIEYREDKGGFQALTQLLEIQGIGDATYEAILPYVAIG